MKKILAVLMLLVFGLSACAGQNAQMERALQLRSKLLAAKGCSFQAKITADYGNKTYSFSMECTADEKGNISFTVTEPETIAGICGKLTDGKGNLTFDDTALAFEMLADGLLTPVAAPWVFLNTLRSGYISSCGEEGAYTRITLHDSYEADALKLDVWLNGEQLPVQGEIMWKDRKILTIAVSNFQIL